ncbi:MAG: hypothetical protein ACRDDC_05220 [Tannerellaceae bacterium]
MHSFSDKKESDRLPPETPVAIHNPCGLTENFKTTYQIDHNTPLRTTSCKTQLRHSSVEQDRGD